MIVMRTSQELLELTKDIQPDVQKADGDYREPERCPYCRGILTPSISSKGHLLMECLDCDD